MTLGMLISKNRDGSKVQTQHHFLFLWVLLNILSLHFCWFYHSHTPLLCKCDIRNLPWMWNVMNVTCSAALSCVSALQWSRMRSSVRYAWTRLWTACFWSVATWSHVCNVASRWTNVLSVVSMWFVWCAPSAFETHCAHVYMQKQFMLAHCILLLHCNC